MDYVCTHIHLVKKKMQGISVFSFGQWQTDMHMYLHEGPLYRF